jgi:transposase
MKKVLLVLALLVGLVSMSYAKTYKCYRYVNGSPVGNWVKVQASSESEAYSKAMAKFRELGVKADSANCHYDGK